MKVLVRDTRIDFVHPRPGGSLGSGVTEENLWEESVASGMTPSKFLAQIYYPSSGGDVLRGKYEGFAIVTVQFLEAIGTILQELDTQVAGLQ